MEPQIFVEKLFFNDGSEMSLGHSDIVIFTGANNAGKSQVLKDIDSIMSNRGVNGIVLKSIDLSYVGDITEKEKRYKLKDGRYQVGGNVYLRLDDIKALWESQDARFAPDFKNRLDTEQRLQASNTAQSYDTSKQEPTTPVQMMYINDKLEENISKLFHEAFNDYLIVNRGGGTKIPIHVGQPPEKAVGEDRVSAGYLEKLRKLPVLQDQGDGMRSFAGILLNVFTTNRSVTMIDEPEAFLHPPQARLLGRMLVKNKPNDRQLFIATHSEDFLKGLLDADSDHVKVVRIERDVNINKIKELDNIGVKSLWKDSILRYSNILSGLFHSKVVICESDTDCRFFQAIMDALYEGEDLVSPDILFTHCGGKERFKNVIPALKALNVKTIVVPDLDVFDNETTFKDICDVMEIQWTDVSAKWKSVFEYVKLQRAQLNTDEARKEIKGYLEGITTEQMSKSDINAIKKMLKASSAWSKVKEAGKNFFSGGAYTDLGDLMKKCKEQGLFVVPVGELEAFYKPAYHNHGTAWVNIVMGLDLAHEIELEEARKFVKEIVES